MCPLHCINYFVSNFLHNRFIIFFGDFTIFPCWIQKLLNELNQWKFKCMNPLQLNWMLILHKLSIWKGRLESSKCCPNLITMMGLYYIFWNIFTWKIGKGHPPSCINILLLPTITCWIALLRESNNRLWLDECFRNILMQYLSWHNGRKIYDYFWINSFFFFCM